jgi:hypothetical protein
VTHAGTSLGAGDVTFGNNTFVAVGSSGSIERSTDNGTNWASVTSGTNKNLFGVTFGNNTFVAVGEDGNILRSTDNGSSWDNATISIDLTGNRLRGVTFGNNRFVGAGDNGKIVRSTDNGTNWDNVTNTDSRVIWDIAFGNNTFVGVTHNGLIVRSTDNGSSFSSWNLSGVNHLTDVSFGNNTFVGVSSVSGVIIRSTDNGSNWTSVDSGTTESLRGVAFTGNWQLIARQVDSDNFTDGTNELFSSNARTTFLQNENDPSSSTFMSIGNLIPSNYVTDGKYKFKLVWDGMQVDSLDNKSVTWTQTSWLTDSTITGFEEIGVSGFSSTDTSVLESKGRFTGLGASDSNSCVIDGSGGSSYWWNCAGVVSLHPYNGSTGMPGPLLKIASSMHLYIWVP